jgi:hypothetical protein
MGSVTVTFELMNHSDIKMAERGLLTPDKIRRLRYKEWLIPAHRAWCSHRE